MVTKQLIYAINKANGRPAINKLLKNDNLDFIVYINKDDLKDTLNSILDTKDSIIYNFDNKLYFRNDYVLKLEDNKYIIISLDGNKRFKDILDVRNYEYLSCLIHLFANEMGLTLTLNDIDIINNYTELQKYYK